MDRTDLKLARVSGNSGPADRRCALCVVAGLIGLDSMERIAGPVTPPAHRYPTGPHYLAPGRLWLHHERTGRTRGAWLRSRSWRVFGIRRFALHRRPCWCAPTDAAAEIEWIGAYWAAFTLFDVNRHNRLRTKDSQLLRRLDAAEQH